MTRDDRVWQMAKIGSAPPTKEFISNFLLENNMIGEPEEVQGDVILVVEQYINEFRLPYSLQYNKPIRKPDLYIEKTMEKAREVLETTNDIINDKALIEFLQRKGLNKSSIWVFSALVKTKLSRQLCMSVILAEAIKRLADKEIFIQSNMRGSEKVPEGITSDHTNCNAPSYKNTIISLFNTIISKKLEAEPRTLRNLLMILFFFRLESMQFYNSLQFSAGTKEYYQGKLILSDILDVPIENPLLFLKVLQNV